MTEPIAMPLDRPASIAFGSAVVPLPCFFPSVSSVKTNLKPVDYIELLAASNHPLWLISAYDVDTCDAEERLRLTAALSAASSKGVASLLDSGNYEAYWKADSTWSVDRFHHVAANLPHHLCFCFDNQRPPSTPEQISADVVARVLKDQQVARGTVIPIVHAPLDTLPSAVKMTVMQLYPIMVAVPERALGNGILARIRTVHAIRSALSELPYYCPLHLLGTGNPISIAAFALAGADSFDGLEWCQTVVDHSSATLSHLQHFDFVRHQTAWGTNNALPYLQAALMHNLEFYRCYLQGLQSAASDTKTVFEFLGRFIAKDRIDTLRSAIEGDE